LDTPQTLFPEIDYIRNHVKLEISCRSLREPFVEIPVRSVIADFTERETHFTVNFASPERTFLEKNLFAPRRISTEQTHAEQL
jgi:hypothetical protein